MNNLQSLKDLFRHMQWADRLVWTQVLGSEHIASDADLRERLYHIHLVQHGFLSVWRGSVERPPGYENFSDMRSVYVWAGNYYEQATAYLEMLSDEDVGRVVEVPWAAMFEGRLGHKAAETSLGETIQQVVLHTAHHRGQVCTKIKELGGEPPLLDLIVWLWAGKPEADWASSPV